MDVRYGSWPTDARWTRAFSDELHVLRCACCARAILRGSVTRRDFGRSAEPRQTRGVQRSIGVARMRMDRCRVSRLTRIHAAANGAREDGATRHRGRFRERFGVAGGTSEGDVEQGCWLRPGAARGEDRGQPRGCCGPDSLPEEAARMRVVRIAEAPASAVRFGGRVSGDQGIACGSCRSPLRW